MVLHTSDYRTVLESFNESEIEEILDEIERDPKKHTYDNVVEYLYDSLPRVIICATDTYSLFRYCLFLLSRLKVPIVFDSPRLESIRDMGEASRVLARNILLLRGEESVTTLFEETRTTIDLYLALISLFEVQPQDNHARLLDFVGSSPYIDALVADLFRTAGESGDPQDLIDIPSGILDVATVDERQMRFFLDLSAEHGLDGLTEASLRECLESDRLEAPALCALLRYVGDKGKTSLTPSLNRLLRQPSLEPSILYTLVDVIAQLGDSASTKVLGNLNASDSLTLSEFIRASVIELERGKERRKSERSEGITLVQCAFYGDLTRPGVLSGGGLGTFLRELGDYLTENDEIADVYTFNLLPMDRAMTEPLLEELRDNHKLVRIPVSFELCDEALDFLENEYEIMRAVRRTLERYDIDPDIFHIRYTDNASKAVLSLAKRLGKKVVFTLTPDPHGTFMQNDKDFRPMSESQLLRNLNKVFIADKIIEGVDALLLIGFERKNSQVLPYFPQLLLDSTIRNKPLRIVAEGVRPEFRLREEDASIYPDLLISHEGDYQLNPSQLGRPIILNAGRLHPMKGQHYLVEAWIRSSLNQSYNLVLVGGNLNNPTPEELSIIKRIEELMESRPELKGQFCHIPAVQNPKVRLLEQSIMSSIKNDLPNLYVCSSFKEEFGISILEGMAAGFLTFAPRRGGVSDYIKDGNNGFLIRTDDAESIRTDIEAVLQHYERKDSLHEIASRGKQFARERLDIGSIGREYLEYYLELLRLDSVG
ncbi:MAG: glycosyltransferase family 1 protein [Candidatus Thorarchaeota archaeon]|nr:MAG: glycosyltransferase family 1 protein [Candidatus Thorarchaeota archaeon]